jgi:hypothetical protein
MNAALNIAIWVSVVVCIAGITVISCWLLLDWQREAGRARAVARMARDYLDDHTEQDSSLQEATEYTWPIVAQQPQVFYEKAITIPIPRAALDVSLPLQRVDAQQPVALDWPAADADDSATSGARLRTEVLPVICDPRSPAAW